MTWEILLLNLQNVSINKIYSVNGPADNYFEKYVEFLP
jgi:hypothetical protein